MDEQRVFHYDLAGIPWSLVKPFSIQLVYFFSPYALGRRSGT